MLVQRGTIYSFLGVSPSLMVDSNKDIIIRNVIICGRAVDDLEESKKGMNTKGTPKCLKLETWDSYLFKVNRRA